MAKTIITNKTYKIILLTILTLSMVERIYMLFFQKFNFLVVVSLVLQTIIIVFIFIGSRHLKLAIKIGFGLTILGCSLGLLSVLLKLFAHGFNVISIEPLIEKIILLTISIPLYIGSGKYIGYADQEENNQMTTE